MSGTEAHEAFAAGNAALADDDFENAIEVTRTCQDEHTVSGLVWAMSLWGVPRTVLSAQVHSLPSPTDSA